MLRGIEAGAVKNHTTQKWHGERLDDCGANQIESLRAKSEVVWSQLRARARCWYVTRRWDEMTRSTLRGEEKRESLDGHVGPKTREAPRDMAGLIAESAPESFLWDNRDVGVPARAEYVYHGSTEGLWHGGM